MDYITEDERINCQKVVDAFEELFANEDIIVLDAGRYGFVRLQYFKFPFGFDATNNFFDSKSMFDDLWEEWLNTQLIDLAAYTPMEDMEYEDIFKCLPVEKREELLGKRLYFAERTGIEGIAEEKEDNFYKGQFYEKTKRMEPGLGTFRLGADKGEPS